MQVDLEDVPSQLQEVLGMLAEYRARNGPSHKRPRGNENEGLPKVMILLCQLVLRHHRDLNSLHHQNTYILFRQFDTPRSNNSRAIR